MKFVPLPLSGLIASMLFIACEKSAEADVALLMEALESKSASKKTLYVGMEYQGGFIFFLDETGRHGLIAAKEDLGPAPWGCFGTAITGARSMEDGYANTQAILEACAEPGIAARMCDQYEARENGIAGRKYSDWFMPSTIQFNSLVSSLGAAGFCGKTYWCSSEEPTGFMAAPVNLANSVNQHAVACGPDPANFGFFRSPGAKTLAHFVRPVRAF